MEDIDIRGRSRRFQIAVVITALLVLFAAVYAVAALDDDGDSNTELDGGSSHDPDLDQQFDPSDYDGGDTSGGSGILELFDLDGLDGLGAWLLQQGLLDDESDIDELDIDPDALDDLDEFDGDIDELDLDLEDLTIPPPPYDITIEPEPTPGSTVVVSVQKDSTPIPGADVFFNGEYVGTTRLDGKLEATVPYTEDLEVTVQAPETAVDQSSRVGAPGTVGQARNTPARIGPTIADSTPVMSTESSVSSSSAATIQNQPETTTSASDSVVTLRNSSPVETRQRIQDEDRNTTVRFDVATDVTTGTEAVALPGYEVPVTFTVNETALPHVTVKMDDDYVGETNLNGTLLIPVPETAQPGETISLHLERDEFLGQAEIEVGELELRVSSGTLPLPGTSGTVEVLAVDSTNEQGIENASVSIYDDDELITDTHTDENGTATFSIPWSNSVTGYTAVDDMTAQDSTAGMLYAVGLLAIGLVILLAGTLLWLVRNPERLQALNDRFIAAILTGGALLERAGQRIYAALGLLREAIAELLGRIQEGITAELLVSPLRALFSRIKWAIRWLLGLPHRLLSENTPPDRQSEAQQKANATMPGYEQRDTAVPTTAYARVLKYWYWLVQRVLGGTPRTTKTAIEVEDRALERGLPAAPVKRLRRAFQSVEYGYAEPAEHVDSAEEAVEELQETRVNRGNKSDERE